MFKTNMEESKLAWTSGGMCDLVDVAGGDEKPLTYVNYFGVIVCRGTLL
jgi:hypothetical protein